MDQEYLERILGHSEGLKSLCLSFFMGFSRFEFALKENGYYVRGRHGEANADWRRFQSTFADSYKPGVADHALRCAPPNQQVVEDGLLTWKAVDFGREKSGLGQIVLMVKTIRNNLFHGGKHGAKDWDEPVRTAFLLQNGIYVLDDLAALAGFDGDYEQAY